MVQKTGLEKAWYEIGGERGKREEQTLGKGQN